MRAFFTVLICGLAAAALLPRNEAEEGWIQIHDGDSNIGWTVDAGSGWTASGGMLTMDGQAAGGYMRSKTAFADFVMRLDVRAAANARASLIVRAARDGNPKETGYEISLSAGASDWPAGSIVGQTKAPAGAVAVGQFVPLEIEASGGSLIVRSQGRVLASSGGLQGIAGIFLLQSNRGGRIDLRNIRLKPTNPLNLFNGSDLSGWKSTGTQPKQGGGKLTKLFGGGKGKPKEVKWTVAQGLIHGEEGPGQLETATAYGDFVLQAGVRMNAKKDSARKRYLLMIRGDAAGLGSGYEIVIQPGGSGAITGLGQPSKAIGAMNQFITLTVAAQDRHIQVWADGAPVTDINDVRPEGTNPRKDARTAAGTIAFYSPDEDANIDIRAVRVVQIAKVLGHSKKAPVAATAGGPPVQQPQAPPPAQPAQPAAGGGQSEQLKALQEQMRQQQQAKADEDQKSQKVSTILQQALNSPSPEQQVQLYDQILQLDPNNQVAFNARKDAQAKIDAQRAKTTEEAEAQHKKEATEEQNRQTLNDSLQKAEASFLTGNIAQAEQSLSIAEKVAPENPAVRALRQRVDAARNRGVSVLALTGAGAGAALVAALAWLMLAGRKRDPYIEMVTGLDKGKKFNVDQEVTSLGAIPEDGGAKNDIVLRDVERMVSRFHAQVLFKDGKLYVVDLGSSNGTTVDKKRIKRAPSGAFEERLPCQLRRHLRDQNRFRKPQKEKVAATGKDSPARDKDRRGFPFLRVRAGESHDTFVHPYQDQRRQYPRSQPRRAAARDGFRDAGE